MMHTTLPHLLTHRVHVALVGAGGSGSQMLTGLARLHLAMTALGHPGGLAITVFDPDFVSPANVARQLFSPTDIGHPKAVVLAHRINCYYGLGVAALPRKFGDDPFDMQCDLVVSCVDTAAARRAIYQMICHPPASERNRPTYWLDLGNRQQDGQAILGQPENGREKIDAVAAALRRTRSITKARKAQPPVRLPTVLDLYPELLDDTLAEDDRPSCSLAEALESQDLFINQAVVTWGLNLLWRLFRDGKIEHHGYFINLATGQVNPLPVPELEYFTESKQQKGE